MHTISAAPCDSDVHPVSDDTALVEAARHDPAAFGLLYHRYFDRVYAYLRARTAGEDDAADLTQQVFLQALDALPRYRGQGGAFAAWLFRIARNTATDFHRRRRGMVAWDLLPEALQPRAEHGVEARLVRHEDLAHLRTLVGALDKDTREILVLRFVARLTIAQIAAVIGKSEAATQSHLFRTIRTFRSGPASPIR